MILRYLTHKLEWKYQQINIFWLLLQLLTLMTLFLIHFTYLLTYSIVLLLFCFDMAWFLERVSYS